MAIDVNIPSQVKTYANLAAFPATGTLKTIFIATDTNKTYRWTGSAYVEISATAASTWGAIGGTLSNQTDLQNALNTKEPTITAGTTSQYYRGDKTFQTLDNNAVGLSNVDNTSDANKPVSTATQTALNAKVTGNTAITGATKTKVTYDSKGLVTAGADATTADIADSLNKRYVTDANLTVIGNTSGTNTGDQTLVGLGGVPTTRTLTINGTTQDLSADRTFTVSTGITIGTTAITSGTVGRVLFEGTGNVVQESANLFWDNTNGRLGIGTSSPTNDLSVYGNTNGNVRARIENISTGTLAFSDLNIRNSVGGVVLQLTGTGNTVAGVTANQARFRTDSSISNGIFISTGGATPIIFATSDAEKLRINGTTGNVLINTTTDAGFKLDVNGTARVKGTGTGYGTFALTVQNSASTNIMRLQDDGYLNVTAGVFTSAVRGVNVEFTNLLYGANFWCTVDGSIKIGSGQSASVASAIFQADSTTRGFLPPRMTTTQKNAIASPATGLQIYDSTLNRPCFYDGTTWITL